jgi:uncharacterized protein (DUF2336 family)
MFDLLKKILGGERQRTVDLSTADAKTRAAIASAKGTQPEILERLSSDAEASVRRAVAGNRRTPVSVAARLARDSDVDVRLMLAARLVELLPDLTPERHSHLYAYAVQALKTLAEDEVLNVRVALSTALKDNAFAPPEVARRLAIDAERAVSEPILRFCAALDDDALLEILSGHPAPWAASAIAARAKVSEQVAAAVIETGDVAAGAALLNNHGAMLSEDTLRRIVTRAPDCPEWHAPAASRPELTTGLARQLAEFVGETVLALLETNTALDPETRAGIAAAVQRRAVHASDTGGPEARVERHAQTGTLNADTVADALALGDARFVTLALAKLGGVHPLIAEKMMHAGAARPIIALCWKAGMPMRLAVTLQRDVAKLAPKDMTYARGGTDYPLTEDEIRWQLEFFGVQAAKG